MAKEKRIHKTFFGKIFGTFWDNFKDLFDSSPNGDISVKDAAQKGINVIDNVTAYWLQYESIFNAIASDDGIESVEKVKETLAEIKADLEVIETIPDIAEKLKDYRFADDDKRNDFYHSLITTAALAFNDGQISLFEAISFATQVAAFIKETK